MCQATHRTLNGTGSSPSTTRPLRLRQPALRAQGVTALDRSRPLALGRTAEFYPWPDGHVLKLFRPGWGEESARAEAAKARAVHDAGFPVPAVGDVIVVDGRPGIPYRHVPGKTLLDTLRERPWSLWGAARLLADLHADLHRRTVAGLPPVKWRLAGKIHAAGLPPPLRDAALARLDSLPDGDRVCHGDFHPDNVIIGPDGPVVIDWPDAAGGDPLADVARTSFLLEVSGLPPGRSGGGLIPAGRRLFHQIYLGRYFRVTGRDRRSFTCWRAVVAAARLAEQVPHERGPLLRRVRALVNESASHTRQRVPGSRSPL